MFYLYIHTNPPGLIVLIVANIERKKRKKIISKGAYTKSVDYY